MKAMDQARLMGLEYMANPRFKRAVGMVTLGGMLTVYSAGAFAQVSDLAGMADQGMTTLKAFGDLIVVFALIGGLGLTGWGIYSIKKAREPGSQDSMGGAVVTTLIGATLSSFTVILGALTGSLFGGGSGEALDQVSVGG